MHNAIRLSTYGPTFQTAPDLVTLHVFSSSVKVPLDLSTTLAFDDLLTFQIVHEALNPQCILRMAINIIQGGPMYIWEFLHMVEVLYIFLPCAPDRHSMRVQLQLLR